MKVETCRFCKETHQCFEVRDKFHCEKCNEGAFILNRIAIKRLKADVVELKAGPGKEKGE